MKTHAHTWNPQPHKTRSSFDLNKLTPPTEIGLAVVFMLFGIIAGNLYAGNYFALWEILVYILMFSIMALTVQLWRTIKTDRRKRGRPWLIASSMAAILTDVIYLVVGVGEFLVFGLNITAILLLISALRSRI